MDKNIINIDPNYIDKKYATFTAQFEFSSFTNPTKLEVAHFWVFMNKPANQGVLSASGNTAKVNISYDELRQLTGYTDNDNKKYSQFLSSLGKKLMSSQLYIHKETKTDFDSIRSGLFSNITIDSKKRKVTISIFTDLIPFFKKYTSSYSVKDLQKLYLS